MEACKYYTVTNNGGRKGVVAFFPDAPDDPDTPEGASPLQQATSDTHDNFDAILKGLEDGDPEVYFEFDVEAKLNREYAQLTDRVSVKGGKIFFDLVEVHNVVADHLNTLIKAGDDPTPIAKFMERVAANPSEHSREHLFTWLKSENFTLTSEGKIVGYKGVAVDSDGTFKSTRSGPAVVNGRPMNGYVPNQPGSIIQMPRDQVTFDPHQTCSAGLHVGNWSYAKSFSQATLEVEVDPADVVSVPVDSNGSKMRVWRYKVIKQVTGPYTEAVKPAEDFYSEAEADDYESEDYDYDDFG